MSGSEYDNLMREIERDEAWFAEVMQAFPTPPCRSIATIKAHVRVAVHESAMRESVAFDAPPMSPDVLVGIKSAIRRELASTDSIADSSPASHAHRNPWRGWFAWGGLAAAAAIVLALSPIWNLQDTKLAQGPSDGNTHSGSPITAPDPSENANPVENSGDDAFALSDDDLLNDYAYALGGGRSGVVSTEIALLDTEIDELADTLTSNDSWQDGWDDELDDLDNDLDALIDDLESVLDV